jgi:RNA polymerase sigma-70 factor (ECF subfamily)
MTGETDRYYIERCLDGHRDEFRHLVLRYQKPLLAGIRCRRAQLDVAEDTAQEAFLRAFANLVALRKPDSFFSWLLGIAYRVLLERADRERRERAGLTRMATEAHAADNGAGPWSGDAALEAALDALTEPCREVVLLRFYGDCSCSEVAERLGIPLGTVTKRLSRAYGELRHSLTVRHPQQEAPCPAMRTEKT